MSILVIRFYTFLTLVSQDYRQNFIFRHDYFLSLPREACSPSLGSFDEYGDPAIEPSNTITNLGGGKRSHGYRMWERPRGRVNIWPGNLFVLILAGDLLRLVRAADGRRDQPSARVQDGIPGTSSMSLLPMTSAWIFWSATGEMVFCISQMVNSSPVAVVVFKGISLRYTELTVKCGSRWV